MKCDLNYKDGKVCEREIERCIYIVRDGCMFQNKCFTKKCLARNE